MREFLYKLFIFVIAAACLTCTAMPLFEEKPRERPCGVPEEDTGAVRVCPEEYPWCSCSSRRCAGRVGLQACPSGFAYGDGTCLSTVEALAVRPSVAVYHPSCLVTCSEDINCDDGAACNGMERCDDGLCSSGTILPGGAPCALTGGGDGICRDGKCVPATCGNGVTDAGEQCDDGNEDDTGDSCRNDCSWRCFADTDCNDDDPCNARAVCDGESHRCLDGEPLLKEGETCSRGGIVGRCRSSMCVPDTCGNGITESDLGEQCDDGNSGDNDACLSNCRRSRCGDGFVFLGLEECDDGNATQGDGCANDCTWTCIINRHCLDRGTCLGCDFDTHACTGPMMPDGAECILPDAPDRPGVCISGECVSQFCNDGDGDGYGEGPACLGADCDDMDPDNWTSCLSCADDDSDGYYAGCDAYVLTPGPDCDDDDEERFPTNTEVCDAKDNDCNDIADDGLRCNIVRQGSQVFSMEPLETDQCVEEFVDYHDWAMHPIPDVRRNNQAVILMLESGCDGFSLVIVCDRENASGGTLSIVLTVVPPSAYTETTLLIDDLLENECDYNAGTGELVCDWDWGLWATDGVAMASFVGDYCITVTFSNISGITGIQVYDGALDAYTPLPFDDLEICHTEIPHP